MADQTFYDRVRTTTPVTGTGNAAVSGTAPDGYVTPQSVYADGERFPYAIGSAGSTEWEAGEGYMTGTGTAMVRETIYGSSNAGAAVSFSSGTKDLIVGINAQRANLLWQTRGMILAIQSYMHLQ